MGSWVDGALKTEAFSSTRTYPQTLQLDDDDNNLALPETKNWNQSTILRQTSDDWNVFTFIQSSVQTIGEAEQNATMTVGLLRN